MQPPPSGSQPPSSNSHSNLQPDARPIRRPRQTARKSTTMPSVSHDWRRQWVVDFMQSNRNPSPSEIRSSSTNNPSPSQRARQLRNAARNVSASSPQGASGGHTTSDLSNGSSRPSGSSYDPSRRGYMQQTAIYRGRGRGRGHRLHYDLVFSRNNSQPSSRLPLDEHAKNKDGTCATCGWLDEPDTKEEDDKDDDKDQSGGGGSGGGGDSREGIVSV